MATIRAGILGASGYTGAELIRLLDRHPKVTLVALGAHSKAGQAARDVFGHLPADLPDMQPGDDLPYADLDVLFAGLPHGNSATILSGLYRQYSDLKILDLSADFRFDRAEDYRQAYGLDHPAPELLAESVYGLSEISRERIANARLVACTGCYCLSAEMPLIPLLRARLIDPGLIVIDAKSGVSGAGRGLKPNLMFAEVNQGMNAYSVGTHRHMWEIDQELSKAAGEEVTVSFTPHLIPVNRGILTNSYVGLAPGASVVDLRTTLAAFYADAPFVRILADGETPKTRNVLGSNSIEIAVFADRLPHRAIVISAIDNLLKGASGQAVQNMNLMFGLDETLGLDRIALYP